MNFELWWCVSYDTFLCCYMATKNKHKAILFYNYINE